MKIQAKTDLFHANMTFYSVLHCFLLHVYFKVHAECLDGKQLCSCLFLTQTETVTWLVELLFSLQENVSEFWYAMIPAATALKHREIGGRNKDDANKKQIKKVRCYKVKSPLKAKRLQVHVLHLDA